MPNYERWHKHGEAIPNDAASDDYQNSNDTLMEEMLFNAAGPEFDWERREDEQPNAEAKDFFNMLAALESPLWEVEFKGESTIKCDQHSVLSAVTQLLAAKADFGLSVAGFDRILTIVKGMLPPNNGLPENFYRTKRMVKGLGMDYKKYDACPKNCMLYYKPEDQLKDKCDICGEPRYTQPTRENSKPVARKILRYLPITPRLQRLYMTRATAEKMRWHKEGVREKPGLMYHPSDAEAWKRFDGAHPGFASEARNVRLGLATDGFAPFNLGGPSYTCWPVVCYPLNLPPDTVMKRENMFLTLVIPGPDHPGRDIDVFLEPLIDELKELWSVGIDTYDVSLKENFRMKAALTWTVNDFPAYSVLSGWMTAGSLGCPCCMDKTKAFRLPKGNKNSWFDCHRKFLPESHSFRGDKKRFIKGRAVRDPIPDLLLDGSDVRRVVEALPDFKLGKETPLNQFPGHGEYHNWTKKSIFWRLEYWQDNMIRHNIDLMHWENNVGGNIVYTVFDIANKIKDNANARKDLELFCNRPKLHLSE